jgi:phosphatidate cytidylyltransferase
VDVFHDVDFILIQGGSLPMRFARVPAMALAFALLFIPHLGKGPCILLAIGLGIFGQLGDFTESMLKRSAQVKDSGTLIPGHGGMLDRLDSFLFSAPFLHYSLLYFLKETP